MTRPLDTLLAELGQANDSATTERPHRMLNTTRDTGEFLAVLVRATLARRILGMGTSNGSSTLWLASAARAIGGAVTTVERSDYKIGLAIFLDSERPEYPGWWPDLKRVLRPGGLRVVDNATSHPAEIAPFVALVSADTEFVTSLVPVDNGEVLAVKADQGWSDRP